MPSFRSASSALGSTVSSFTCAKPAGAVSGDMLIMCHATDVSLTSMGTPTGGTTWNSLDSTQWLTSSGGMKLWWKFAGGSEPSSYSLSQASSSDGTCSIICVQSPGAGVLVFAKNAASVATTSVPTPSTLPSAADDFEIRCVGAPSNSSGSFTPPGGLVERTDLYSGSQYAAQSCATRTLTGSGPTGVLNFTSSTSLNAYIGYTINIGATAPPPQFIGWGMRI